MIDNVPNKSIKKFSARKFRKIKNKNPNNYMVPEILLSIVNNTREFCSNP